MPDPCASATLAINPLDHQGLVHSIARGFVEQGKRRGLSYDDLVSEGQIGLLRACQLYNPSKGAVFSTYATLWIRQAIGRAIRSATWPIHVPAWAVDEITAQARGRTTVATQRRREGASACLERARSILQAQVYHEHEGAEVLLSQTLAGRPDGDRLDRREYVEGLLSRLPSRQADVLRARYGLDGTPTPPREIAKALGVTRSRVVQIEAEAIGELRVRLGGAANA